MRIAVFENQRLKKVGLSPIDRRRREFKRSLEPRRDPEAHRNRLQLFHDTPVFRRIVNAQTQLGNRWLIPGSRIVTSLIKAGRIRFSLNQLSAVRLPRAQGLRPSRGPGITPLALVRGCIPDLPPPSAPRRPGDPLGPAYPGLRFAALSARGPLAWVELDPKQAGDPDLSLPPSERDARWRVIVRWPGEIDE